MITLIQYKNRKIYNKETAKYVTSQDVVDMLLATRMVSIVERDTGKDVTHKLLVNMGASQLRQGNVTAGRILIRYADSYRPTSSVVGGI